MCFIITYLWPPNSSQHPFQASCSLWLERPRMTRLISIERTMPKAEHAQAPQSLHARITARDPACLRLEVILASGPTLCICSHMCIVQAPTVPAASVTTSSYPLPEIYSNVLWKCLFGLSIAGDGSAVAALE